MSDRDVLEPVHSVKIHGRNLSREDRTEFSVKGVRGRFAFDHAVVCDGDL